MSPHGQNDSLSLKVTHFLVNESIDSLILTVYLCATSILSYLLVSLCKVMSGSIRRSCRMNLNFQQHKPWTGKEEEKKGWRSLLFYNQQVCVIVLSKIRNASLTDGNCILFHSVLLNLSIVLPGFATYF